MSTNPHEYTSLITGGAACFIACVAIVLTQRWHGQFSHDSAIGIQRFHTVPTPRIGGIGFVIGLTIALFYVSDSVKAILEPMLIAGVPAFLFGVAEDITKRVGVRERLLATMASGTLAWWLTDISLTRVDVPLLDTMLTWMPMSVLFTAFAAGGIANAINIIDGFNGLSSGVVIIALSALSAIAYSVGDPALGSTALVLGGVTLGFLLVNFPFGKIFLGDGGAYLLGFMLAWIGILLPMRNPSVSPWASLLVCAYPILEVLFSVLRRLRRKQHPGHPDRLHLHSLIKCRIARKKLSFLSPVLRNSAVSPIVWAMATLPATCAVFFYNNPAALFLFFLLSALLYSLVYTRLALYRWKIPGAIEIAEIAKPEKLKRPL